MSTDSNLTIKGLLRELIQNEIYISKQLLNKITTKKDKEDSTENIKSTSDPSKKAADLAKKAAESAKKLVDCLKNKEHEIACTMTEQSRKMLKQVSEHMQVKNNDETEENLTDKIDDLEVALELLEDNNPGMFYLIRQYCTGLIVDSLITQYKLENDMIVDNQEKALQMVEDLRKAFDTDDISNKESIETFDETITTLKSKYSDESSYECLGKLIDLSIKNTKYYDPIMDLTKYVAVIVLTTGEYDNLSEEAKFEKVESSLSLLQKMIDLRKATLAMDGIDFSDSEDSDSDVKDVSELTSMLSNIVLPNELQEEQKSQ